MNLPSQFRIASDGTALNLRGCKCGSEGKLSHESGSADRVVTRYKIQSLRESEVLCPGLSLLKNGVPVTGLINRPDFLPVPALVPSLSLRHGELEQLVATGLP